MAKLSDRLIARLIAEGFISPGEYRIERTYAGYWQRTEGAWSWELVRADGGPAFVGSQWTVKECLRAPVLEIMGSGLMPVTEDGRLVVTRSNGPGQ